MEQKLAIGVIPEVLIGIASKIIVVIQNQIGKNMKNVRVSRNGD